jgi:16S rRNA (uracil1498-N3)-methyltransferase
MARELRRLLISPERIAAADRPGADGPRLALEGQEGHYLQRVLRYRAGDRLAVVDGCGGLWTAVLEPEGALRLEQVPDAPLIRQPPLGPPLELAMAVPKREAELVWRMATELGADRLQPLVAGRCVAGERIPLQRWQAIVREATEQCERLWQPCLLAPQPAASWLGTPVAGIALLATTRRQGLPLCGRLLEDLGAAAPGESGGSPLRLAIGPEGGWTPEEEARAEAAGWQPVSLGDTILRTATAAVSGLALLAQRRALSSASCRRPSP